MITMHNMDCMEAMASMPDKAYELAIVDPPYGINAHVLQPPSDSYRKRTGRNPSRRLNSGAGKLKNRLLNKSNCGWDSNVPSEGYFQELKRISINQIIWGGNYFPLPPTRGIIAWDKVQPWTNFSQFELAWTSFDTPARIFTFNKSFVEDKFHPTQKPVALYKWLLQNYAKPGDKILDTHGGSGSICIACHDLGYDLDWYELDKDYYNTAVKRYEKHKQQPDMFIKQPDEVLQEEMFR